VNKNFNTIIFRNYFNNGDLHVVRSFIKYVKDLNEYNLKLNHPQSIKTLADLNIPLYWGKNQKYKTFDNRGYNIDYGCLIINTQYLAFNGEYFRKYSATIQTLWCIFDRIFKEVFKIDIPTNLELFIPKINYHYPQYETTNIDKMLHNSYDKRILICNNDFGSAQAINFNFDDVIKFLSNTYKNYGFYITNNTNVKNDNVYYVGDYVKEHNLNEISYLSTKCDILIGRNSGPHTFCYVKENLLNPIKKFVSFSAPSGLYGSDPEKWLDFGIKEFTTKDRHAQFFNIRENDCKIRINEICKIIDG
jgi:hypothetical protein